MREALINGRLVVAGPGSPEKAICPSCGEEVKKTAKFCGECGQKQ